MRTYVMILFWTCFSCITFSQANYLNELYHLLDQQDIYTEQKEQRIREIKNMLLTPGISQLQQYNIQTQLVDEYKPYIADLAIHYAGKNLQIALELKDKKKVYETKFSLCFLYAISGMYIEANDLLQSIKTNQLSSDLLADYYNTSMLFYEFYALSNPINEEKYKRLNLLYQDSLLNILSPSSWGYKKQFARKLSEQNRVTEAKQILDSLLKESPPESRNTAYLAYDLALIYGKEDNKEKQKEYFALSAISDIKNSVKENISLRELALLLYEEGDIRHAYKCIEYATEDAIFSNAQLRTVKIPRIFSIINTANKEKDAKQRSQLITSLITISILSFFLIISLLWVYNQMKKITRIRRKLAETNSILQSTNQQLSSINKELSQSDKTKEVYISRFLQMCSMYINKMDTYRKTIHRKVTAGQLNELHKMTATDKNILLEKKELYDIFDKAFLTLYPDFVEQMNTLFKPEERIEVKSDELLTNDLRIFALVRLGIKDSAQISDFLGVAPSTTYTYRTKMKSKAIDRDNFEENIMKIK